MINENKFIYTNCYELPTTAVRTFNFGDFITT